MIRFEDFLNQDECDKYNMLQECNAIIQQKEIEIKSSNKRIEHTSNELQKLIDDINNKTIISLGSFSIKLETIQDELVGGVDKSA